MKSKKCPLESRLRKFEEVGLYLTVYIFNLKASYKADMTCSNDFVFKKLTPPHYKVNLKIKEGILSQAPIINSKPDAHCLLSYLGLWHLHPEP